VYASDIYALGVSSIYLLTQISPFDLFSDSEFQWVWRQFFNGIVVNDKLGRVLDKMLEQALVRRYQTVEDVLQDLDLSKKSPISTPVNSQPVLSVAIPPVTKPSFLSGLFSQPAQPQRTPVSNSSNSLVLDCGNGVKLELVKVVAGSFNMGSNEYDREEPIHRVNLREFFIGKYPVTQAQYQAVIGKNPSNFKGSQNPVEEVSCHDAVKFCEELSKRIGQKVKLPSEAQWEYACRAGSTGKYCFGDDDSKLGNYAWYDKNSGSKTHPVGEKLANSWGLHDMHGNVWEWCEDVWHENYNGAPTDGSSWLTGGGQNRRALRGGSCGNNDNNCRSASRNWYYAFNCDDLGFRVVV
jgi:formylglycine-generating enzyme required for sulfatase activity